VCRTFIIHICICCFCLYASVHWKKYDAIICNLFSLSLCLYRSLECYCSSIMEWKEQNREKARIVPFLFSLFLRVRPVCPSYKQYLYTYTRTHSYTDVIGGRNIKSYTHIHSFTCPSIALDLSFVSSSHIWIYTYRYISFHSIDHHHLHIILSYFFSLYFMYSNDNNDDSGQNSVLIYLFEVDIVQYI